MATNGDVYRAVSKIEQRLVAIETRQEERHEVNQKDMKIVKGFAEVIEKHCQAITRLQTHRAIHWFLIGAIIVAIILK